MRKDCGDAAETVRKDYGSSADIVRTQCGTWAVPLRTRRRSALLGHHKKLDSGLWTGLVDWTMDRYLDRVLDRILDRCGALQRPFPLHISRAATQRGNAPFQCFGCTRPPTHKLDPLHPGVVLATLLPYTSSRKHEIPYAK